MSGEVLSMIQGSKEVKHVLSFMHTYLFWKSVKTILFVYMCMHNDSGFEITIIFFIER